MGELSPLNWFTSAGTIVAAAVSAFAAYQSKRSADQAARTADVANTQLELQRPRPLVIATFANLYALAKRPGDEDDKDFELKNIGNSPAFDVRLSTLIVGHNRLSTGQVAYLLPDRPVQAKHEIEPPAGTVMANCSGKGLVFAKKVSDFLENDSTSGTFKNSQGNYEIPFTVSYHALDGHPFKQSYALILDRLLARCWTEALGSLIPERSLEQP